MQPLTQEEILAAFHETGAFTEGHFVLTSGRHSDRYVQCARILEHTELTTRFAMDLVQKMDTEEVDLVASPAVGGIIIGFAVAQALGVKLIFSEREEGAMRFRRGFEVPEGARVLIVEDVVTTGGSVAEVAGLVRRSGGTVTGVAALVDRGGTKVFDAPFTALVELEVESWDAEKCPLCAAGVPPTAPGSRALSG
jgi:orotate phosphoribosyltransferase